MTPAPEILLTDTGGEVIETHPSWKGFAVIDTETTGGWPHHGHRVVEISVVQMSLSGEFESVWQSLIDPGRSPGPTHVHGISAADLDGAPTFEDLADEVVRLLADRTLVAHNAAFDIRFLHHEFALLGRRWDPPSVLCTMKLAQRTGVERPWTLTALSREFAVPHVPNHTARDDAITTAYLLAELLTQTATLGASYQELRLTPPPEWVRRTSESRTTAPRPTDSLLER